MRGPKGSPASPATIWPRATPGHPRYSWRSTVPPGSARFRALRHPPLQERQNKQQTEQYDPERSWRHADRVTYLLSCAARASASASVKPLLAGPAIMSLPIVMGASVTGEDCTSPLMTKAVEASTASFQLLWLAG